MGRVWCSSSPPGLSHSVIGAVPADVVGCDSVEQCTAWMEVGEGHVANQNLPLYTYAENAVAVYGDLITVCVEP